MYKILIVEDDYVIAESVSKHIITWGFEGKIIEDFKNVLGEFAEYKPQLVLMDISLPFFNGYHWCSEIRKISKVPIIFISSASDNFNIVMAMNMGGDDFVSKPFDLAVLTAKIQALLRRSYDFVGQSDIIEHKGAILNIAEASLTFNNQKIDLSKNEFRILQVLMKSKGEVISRDTLMMRLWETDNYVDENTLTVNVTRLRKHLESIGLIDFIKTKKGIGYIIE